MPVTRSPAQQAASRANGTRPRGPITDAGKARSAGNGTRQGPRGGPFALLPGEEKVRPSQELHAAITADWRPRDAYERRWVQESWSTPCGARTAGTPLELATLAGAAAESPPSEAMMQRLLTLARYGARFDKDIGRALEALRVLRDRMDGLKECTSKPEAESTTQIRTNNSS